MLESRIGMTFKMYDAEMECIMCRPELPALQAVVLHGCRFHNILWYPTDCVYN